MNNNNIYIHNITRLLASLSITLFASTATGQQISDPTQNKPHSISPGTPVPVDYPGLKDLNNVGKYNYIRTTLPDVPLANPPSSTNDYYRESTDYYDGLGRPLQTVGRKAHADGNDIVKAFVYNTIGQEAYQYLPYAAPTGGILYSGAIGSIKLRDSSQLRYFYDESGPDEQPYGQVVYDNSPLNKIVKSLAPGKSWVGSGRGVAYAYFANGTWTYNSATLTGGFPRWSIATTPGAIPVYQGEYAAGQLYMTSITDEDGKSRIDVKDKQGRLIMSLAGLTLNSWGSTKPTDYSYTCYVYDKIGRLRCVMPPEVAKPSPVGTSGSVNWNAVTQAQMDGFCYSFYYDGRDRLLEKKVPGKDVEYYAYDKRDRQVMYQDGNLRDNKKWQFNCYDALDRVVFTGQYGTGTLEARATIQGYLDNAVVYTSPSLFYYLKKYDLYNTYPTTINNGDIYSYNYFDNYNGLSGLGFDASQFNNSIPAANTLPIPSQVSSLTKGLSTWNKSRILDPETALSNTWLSTTNYYDAKGRVIQTVNQNLTGGTDFNSNVYYFQGTLYKNISRHYNPNAVSLPGATDPPVLSYTIENKFERNFKRGGGNDMVLKQTQKINDEPEYELCTNSYDHLGRTTLKQWTAGLNLKEYNIRGFVNHIAFRNYDQDTAFNENIFYDKGFDSKLYNGNIAGITWSGSDHKQRAYGYSYDNLNRLNHAEFNQYDGSIWSKSEGDDFTVSAITYDLNGNIKTMNQMGRAPYSVTPSIQMDALTYTYAANTNQLSNVKDIGLIDQNLPDFKDDLTGNNTSVVEYNFDKNGNMNLDLNKKVSSITYNYLNKPAKITIDGKGQISCTYDVMGNRLRKKVVDVSSSTTDTWDYIGNLIYKNNELQYILNEEGRARPILADHDNYPSVPEGTHPTKFVYDYFIKDHLGNVRSTFTSKPNAYNYVAKHNISTANIEELIFDNIPNVRDVKPGSGNPDDMAARLNGSEPDKRIGTAIMLQTNPGDRFLINVNAFYDGDYEQDNEISSTEILESLMGTLLSGSTIGTKPIPVEGLPDNQAVIRSIFSDPSLPSQIDNLQRTNNNLSAPKAHLNYLWFDEHLQFQAAGSGSVQITANVGNWNIVTAVGDGVLDGNYVSSRGRGFLVVYIDNQSIGKDVWFDNLSISNYESSVLEEDHYYPFGLALNTTASTNRQNPYKYQGVGLERHFGLETYETFYRGLDPQLGRFNSVDRMADKYFAVSPYVSMGNNPSITIDPMGDTTSFYMAGSKDPFLVLNDKGTNRVNIINEGQNDDFQSAYNVLTNMFHISDPNSLTKLLGGFGVTYDLQSVSDFYEKYSKTPADIAFNHHVESNRTYTWNGKKITPMAERNANLVIDKNGIVVVGQAGNPAPGTLAMTRCWPNDLPYEYNKVSHVHLHPFAEEGEFKEMQNGQVPFQTDGFNGQVGPSGGDYENSNNTQYRKVMVDKNNIYLYNKNSSQTITVPRP
jgi:hypothetical protein